MGGSLRRLKKNRPKVRTGLKAKNRAGKKVKEVHLSLPSTSHGRDGAHDGEVEGGARRRDSAAATAVAAGGGGRSDVADDAVDVRLGGSWEVKKSTIQNYKREGVTGDANAAVSAAARPHPRDGDGEGTDLGDDEGEGDEGEWGRRIRTATEDEIAIATGKSRSTGKAPPRRLTVRRRARLSLRRGRACTTRKIIIRVPMNKCVVWSLVS